MTGIPPRDARAPPPLVGSTSGAVCMSWKSCVGAAGELSRTSAQALANPMRPEVEGEGGGNPVLRAEQWTPIRELAAQRLSISRIARELEVHRHTVHTWLFLRRVGERLGESSGVGDSRARGAPGR